MLPSSRKNRFEHVVCAYASDLFRYLYWLSRDRAQAEDLVQETFARAWAAWATQRDEKAVKAWLFTIGRNEFARLHERKVLDIDPEADLEAIASLAASDPGLALDLRQAFAKLPAPFRDALLLQVLGGLSTAEIAAALETGEDAINMRLTRARKALRLLLDGPPNADRTRKANP